MPECGQVDVQAAGVSMAAACSLAIAAFLFALGLGECDKLTSIAGSKRHRCSQGFWREAKRFAVRLAEAIVPSALLAEMVDDFAALFAVPAVDLTASSIC
jgi:hypothetical protein